MFIKLLFWQGLDIYWRDHFICPTEEEYIDMVLKKTGGLMMLAFDLMDLFRTTGSDSSGKLLVLTGSLAAWHPSPLFTTPYNSFVLWILNSHVLFHCSIAIVGAHLLVTWCVTPFIVMQRWLTWEYPAISSNIARNCCYWQHPHMTSLLRRPNSWAIMSSKAKA